MTIPALELVYRLLKRAAASPVPNPLTTPFKGGWQSGPMQPWHPASMSVMSNLMNPMPGGMVDNPGPHPGYLTPGVQESLDWSRQSEQIGNLIPQLQTRGAAADVMAGRQPMTPEYQLPAAPVTPASASAPVTGPDKPSTGSAGLA